MRKLMLLSGTLALLSIGCSHTIDRTRAEYHQNRADAAAQKGDYYKAADQQRKADVDSAKAATAPLP